MARSCGADCRGCSTSIRNSITLTTFITGAAGFIGSHVFDRLLRDGEDVVGYDNFSTGMPEFIASAQRHQSFTFVEGDLLDTRTLTENMRGASRVAHFAANADVRFGLDHPRKDLEQNTIATFNVLEAMRAFLDETIECLREEERSSPMKRVRVED